MQDRLRLTKRMLACAVIAELSVLEMGTVEFALKHAVEGVRANAKKAQMWFFNHPKAKQEHKTDFADFFFANELPLIGAAIDALLQFPEEDLERAVTALHNALLPITPSIP